MSTARGRVAIVTGAGRGIGAATASRLSHDGLAVAALDRNGDAAEETARTIEKAGGTVLAVTADISSSAQVNEAVDRVVAELGAPTVLVNNAGISRDSPFEEMTEEAWDAVMNVNLRGTFLMCQAVRSHLVHAHWGRIVNVSSMAGVMGTRNMANYAATKAGIEGFTRTLAIELGPEGITVNAVAPGYIVSDMTAESAARYGVKFEKLQKVIAAQTPVRRVGQPEDIAHTVAFLVDEATGFITGQVIQVTGGMTA